MELVEERDKQPGNPALKDSANGSLAAPAATQASERALTAVDLAFTQVQATVAKPGLTNGGLQVASDSGAASRNVEEQRFDPRETSPSVFTPGVGALNEISAGRRLHPTATLTTPSSPRSRRQSLLARENSSQAPRFVGAAPPKVQMNPHVIRTASAEGPSGPGTVGYALCVSADGTVGRQPPSYRSWGVSPTPSARIGSPAVPSTARRVASPALVSPAPPASPRSSAGRRSPSAGRRSTSPDTRFRFPSGAARARTSSPAVVRTSAIPTPGERPAFGLQPPGGVLLDANRVQPLANRVQSPEVQRTQSVVRGTVSIEQILNALNVAGSPVQTSPGIGADAAAGQTFGAQGSFRSVLPFSPSLNPQKQVGVVIPEERGRPSPPGPSQQALPTQTSMPGTLTAPATPATFSVPAVAPQPMPGNLSAPVMPGTLSVPAVAPQPMLGLEAPADARGRTPIVTRVQSATPTAWSAEQRVSSPVATAAAPRFLQVGPPSPNRRQSSPHALPGAASTPALLNGAGSTVAVPGLSPQVIRAQSAVSGAAPSSTSSSVVTPILQTRKMVGTTIGQSPSGMPAYPVTSGGEGSQRFLPVQRATSSLNLGAGTMSIGPFNFGRASSVPPKLPSPSEFNQFASALATPRIAEDVASGFEKPTLGISAGTSRQSSAVVTPLVVPPSATSPSAPTWQYQPPPAAASSDLSSLAALARANIARDPVPDEGDMIQAYAIDDAQAEGQLVATDNLQLELDPYERPASSAADEVPATQLKGEAPYAEMVQTETGKEQGGGSVPQTPGAIAAAALAAVEDGIATPPDSARRQPDRGRSRSTPAKSANAGRRDAGKRESRSKAKAKPASKRQSKGGADREGSVGSERDGSVGTCHRATGAHLMRRLSSHLLEDDDDADNAAALEAFVNNDRGGTKESLRRFSIESGPSSPQGLQLFSDAITNTAKAEEARHPQRAGVGRLILKHSKKALAPQGLAKDADAKVVERLFFDSMPLKIVAVDSIEQVISSELLKRFLSTIAKEKGAVEATFHGTKPDLAKKIVEEGLSTSICQTGAYGHGAYVGTHAGVAHQYADADKEGRRYMCLILVVAGSKVVKGHQGEAPEATASDSLANPTQYCFVDEERLLVSHMITYRAEAGARKRIGGGWQDPFQTKLSGAVRRAEQRVRKRGLR